MRVLRKLCGVTFCFCLCLFLSSCATTNISNINKTSNFQFIDGEESLWKRAHELKVVLNRSGFIYQDPELTKYVNGVLHRLVGEFAKDEKVNLKVYILRDPYFNAFCLPDGTIYIHTSILANLDNEAQLAVILAHEAVHFLHRHTLKELRSVINKTAFLSVLQITLAGACNVFTPGASGSSVDLVRLISEYAVLGSYYGYSRGIEREADKGAFDIITHAGYDPRETKNALENMYEANKDEKVKIPYFYQSHPRTRERIKNFERFISDLAKSGKSPLTGETNTETYRQMTKCALLDNAELDMKRNSLRLARNEIDKYNKLYPDDYKGYYLLGKLNYLDSKAEDAEENLVKSLQLNPDCSDSHRELGMLYYKQGKKEQAKAKFTKYLELKPQATDAEYIRSYLNE